MIDLRHLILAPPEEPAADGLLGNAAKPELHAIEPRRMHLPEVLIGGIGDHRVERLLDHCVRQQSLAILTEGAMLETRLIQTHGQEPAEEQISVQPITESPVAPD